MSILTKRQQPQSAVSVGGSLEPVEPVYTEPNQNNAIVATNPPPSETVGYQGAVVSRHEDTTGMRYLYSDSRYRQPISSLGTGPDIGVAVWSSEFQPTLGVLRDYGFYDSLYRAGYPGFNLGISFKVQQNPSTGTNGPGFNIKMKSPNVTTIITNPFKRATNASASMKG